MPVSFISKEISVFVGGIETYRSAIRELDCIRQQVVYDLCDTVYVTVKHDIRILEIAKKKNAFIVHHIGKAGGYALQPIVQAERYVVACLLGFVKAVHIQQIVQKV